LSLAIFKNNGANRRSRRYNRSLYPATRRSASRRLQGRSNHWRSSP